MMSRLLGNLAIASFAIVILSLALLNQKPPCINSSVIEKISFSNQEMVYRCSLKKVVPFSSQFFQYQSILESQIQALESWSSTYFSLRGMKIQIEVTPEEITAYSSGSKIVISEKSLANPLVLQKELLKRIVSQVGPPSISNQTTGEFFSRVWDSSPQPKIGGVESFVANLWLDYYNRLNLKHKHFFLKRVAAGHFQLNSSQEKKYELQAKFDVLFVTPKMTSDSLRELRDLQLKFPTKELGIWDGTNLFHGKSNSFLSKEWFSKIQTHHSIWETCGITLQNLLEWPGEVQKVFVVKVCQGSERPDFSSYLLEGSKGFARKHQGVSFVLIDLPSLKSKQAEFDPREQLFQLISHPKLTEGLFLALGWQSLEFDQTLKVSKPQAYVDAIETFRSMEN